MNPLAVAFIISGLLFYCLQFSLLGKLLALSYIAAGFMVSLETLPYRYYRLFIYFGLFVYSIFALHHYLTDPAMPEVALVHLSMFAMASLVMRAIYDREVKKYPRKLAAKPLMIDPVKNRKKLYVGSIMFILTGIILGNVLEYFGIKIAHNFGPQGGVALVLPFSIAAAGICTIYISVMLIFCWMLCLLVDIIVTQSVSGKNKEIGLNYGLLAGALLFLLLFFAGKFFYMNELFKFFRLFEELKA